MSDAIERLEAWRAQSKAHSIAMEVDNGYGATCWMVTLYKCAFKPPGRKVVASEEVFISFDGVDEHWHEDGDTLYVSPKTDEPFPGLEATIHCAINAAERWPL